MTIKQKLSLSIITLIVIFSSLCLYLVSVISQQSEQTTYAFNTPLAAVNNSQQALSSFIGASNYVTSVLSMEQPATPTAIRSQFNQYKQAFFQALTGAKQAAISDALMDQSKDIETRGTAWFELIEKHIQGNQNSLFDARILDVQQAQIENMLNQFATDTLKASNRIANELEQQNSTRQTLVISLVVVIATVSFFAVVLIIRSLIQPLNQLNAAVAELNRGEADLTQRINIRRSDELGVLSTQFNLFIERIQGSVTDIAQAVSQSEQQLSGFGQITEQTHHGSMQQKREVDNISRSMDSVVDSVNQVNQQAHAATEQSESIYQDTMESVKVIDQINKDLTHLSNNVEHANVSIAELGQSSNDIGLVLDVIENIAEQTNLLALNAAIEAARAGEAGRGFAVVAEEVRNLAIKTQESTTNIQSIISKIQQQVNDVKQVMEDGRDEARNCANKNLDLAGALKQIETSIENVKRTNSEVQQHTQGQNQSIKQMNENLSALVSIADRSNKGNQELSNRSLQAIESVNLVQQSVKQFNF